MSEYKIHVNGKDHTVNVDDDTPLLWVLRDELNLVGTKFGCGMSQCGACTIHINGDAARSCSVPIRAIKDAKVTTIEGLSEAANHPLQKAWKEHDVPQCGYCQSGQIMGAAAYFKGKPNPSEEEINLAMHGHICRCGSYPKIKAAIKSASKF